MAKPFRIFIAGQELTGYTDARLERNKSNLSGVLEISLFMNYVPASPVMTFAITGAEILAYVGENLAFVGSIDRRSGNGVKSGAAGSKDTAQSETETQRSVSIGPDQYTVKISARGTTKKLVDGAIKHPTGSMYNVTNKDVVDELLKDSDIEVEWLATTLQLDKVRFRDGATIWTELLQLSTENAHFMYQTRDGKLRVTDDTGRTVGDSLILGQNVLTFNAEQSEDGQNGTIKVKGQRTSKEVWGEDAILDIIKEINDSSATNKAPIVIQHYGDGTPTALERRAKFEADKRTSASKTVNIEVFHIQSVGEPWDIGNLHYVEIPPEGVFDVMECTGLSYTITADKELKTALTLAPPPSSGVSGGVTGGTGFTSPELEEIQSLAASQKIKNQATTQPGLYPASWGGATLSMVNPLLSVFNTIVDNLPGLKKKESPPKKLPLIFTEHDT